MEVFAGAGAFSIGGQLEPSPSYVMSPGRVSLVSSSQAVDLGGKHMGAGWYRSASQESSWCDPESLTKSVTASRSCLSQTERTPMGRCLPALQL